MLKKTDRGNTYFEQLPKIPQYEQVHALKTSSVTDQEIAQLSRREISERNARVLEKGQASIEKMIDRYLTSNQPLDLARVNNTVLRIAARFPDRRSSDASTLKTLYDKSKSAASRSMAERRNRASGRELDQLTESSREIMRMLESLESSVTQLLNIMDARRRVSPESTFATSVDLDVRYGIDLIEAIPHFITKRDALVVDFNLYQCKASRVGLADDEIRSLASRYRRSAQLTTSGEHLVIDPDYFERELQALEQAIEAPALSEDEMLDGILSEGDYFREVLNQTRNTDSSTRYLAQRKLHAAVGAFAKEVGEHNPLPAPNLQIGRVEMLFGVDTRRGLSILSLGEAEQFGQNPAPNRHLFEKTSQPTLAK